MAARVAAIIDDEEYEEKKPSRPPGGHCLSCGVAYLRAEEWTPCPVCLLTPKQQEVNTLLAGPQRHTLLYGGVRSGKTLLIVRAILQRAIHAPETRHAILRLHANAVRASIWLDTLPKAAKLWYPQFTLLDRRMDGYVEIKETGSQIWMAGTDEHSRIEKILGQEFLSLYFNECSQIPYQTVLLILTRLAQTSESIRQRAYYDLNPVGRRHYTAQLFLDGLDPVTGTPIKDAHNRRHAWMNPRDNRAYLSQDFLESLSALPPRQRKRFEEGIYQAEVDGALWTMELLEQRRWDEDEPLPKMTRIVVSVDPAGRSGEEADETGIIVAGRDAAGHGYVMQDASGHYSPSEWAKRAIGLYYEYRADLIVAETNFGADMVINTIYAVDDKPKVKGVHASRGKAIRAEPVQALYEPRPDFPLGRIRHVGELNELEDQLCALTIDFDPDDAGFSPDRADAAIWALTELFVEGSSPMVISDDVLTMAHSIRPRRRY